MTSQVCMCRVSQPSHFSSRSWGQLRVCNADMMVVSSVSRAATPPLGLLFTTSPFLLLC